MISNNKCAVLIADCQKDDRLLLRLVLRRSAPTLELVAEVPDAQSLMHYFSGTGPYEDRSVHSIPELVILGSDMLSEDGFDVIGWIRSQDLPTVKIAVLAEPLPEDQLAASPYAAADYVFSKTCVLRELERIVKLLETELVSHA